MSDGTAAILTIFVIVIIFLLGMLVGGSNEKERIQEEAVAAGVGQYNSTTANFEWRTE